jgi:hypothetical protein
MVAGSLGYSIRLAREQCFVDIGCTLADHNTVGNDLITSICNEQIARYDLRAVNAAPHSIAHHGHTRTSNDGDVVQYALGVDFLDQPHGHVHRDNADRDHRIRGPTQRNERDGQAEQHRVDERENVISNDPNVGSACWKRGRIRLASASLLFNLLAAQAPSYDKVRLAAEWSLLLCDDH